MGEPLIHIDLGNLSEPVTKLIDVVAKGTGLTALGTVLQAKADAKAKVISTKSDIEAQALIERAQTRHEHREIKRQRNIENIVQLAVNELPALSSTTTVDEDWITQFFDIAQGVSDQQIQILWARILAGEVASPGSYAKRTLLFLKSFGKWEAEKFSGLCSLSFTVDGWPCIAQNAQTETELSQNLGNGAEAHFISIGLLLPLPNSLPISSLNNIELDYAPTKNSQKIR
jgi:Protein of unknown function (DUF2806)